MKALAWAAGAAGLLLTVYGLTQAIDRHGDAQAQMAHAWRDACQPQAGQTVVIVSDGRVANCRIYVTASMSPGMARQLVSAAAVALEAAP